MRVLAVAAPLLIFAGLGAAFYIGLNREDPDALPSTFVGRPAPLLNLEPLSDLPMVRDEDLKAEGFKLVNFWASWCPPCRAEHPTLMALKDEGWTIVGINKSDSEQNALGFLNELGDPYTKHGADPTGRRAIDWGVYGLPETFLVDGNGNILRRYPGPVTRRVWQDTFLPVIESRAN